MAINNNVTIEQSLIGQTVLQSSFNFLDPIEGAKNQHTLLNRVKKLGQSDREALISELGELTAKLRSPTEPVVIKDRSLSLVLLIDDGTDAKVHGFFMSILLGFLNLFGCRVSSQQVMEQISAFRTALTDSGIHARMDFTPNEVEQIRTTINNIKLGLEGDAFVGQVDGFVRQVLDLYSEFSAASEKKWGSLDTFFVFDLGVRQLGSAMLANNAIPQSLQRVIIASLERIGTVAHQGRSGVPVHELAENLHTALINDLDEQTREKLKAIGLEEEQSSVEILQKKLIVPLIKSEMEVIIVELNNYKERIQGENGLIGGRLVNFQNNLVAKNRINSRLQSEANIRIAQKALQDQTDVCKMIDRIAGGITVSLIDISNRIIVSWRSLEAIKDNELKNTGDFSTHLENLVKVVNDDNRLDKQAMADIIHPELFDDFDGLATLRSFKARPNAYELVENKQVFINAYVTYLKGVFDLEKRNKTEELGQAQQRLSALLRQQPVMLPPYLAPQGQLGALNAPNNLQPVVATSSVVINPPLDIARQTYSNFYFIMKNADLIGAENGNWGDIVYNALPGGYGNLIIEGTDEEVIGRARIQATREVEENHFRNAEQPF